MIFNACSQKFTSYLGLSNIQRSNLLPQISMSITSFSQNYSNGSWFATCMAIIRDIYLFYIYFFISITGNHQDSLRDAEAAIELNPTFLKAIVRG